MADAARHVYDWARARGYWLRSGQDDCAPSHLLLDGGRLAVPPASHGALLNAYATSVLAHPSRPPCMVELRTPVFRMFADLDARFASEADALRAGRLEGPFAAALGVIAGAACPGQAAVVCVASAAKRETTQTQTTHAGVTTQTTYKMGFHVVWPEALVTARTALALRQRALDALRDLGVDAAGAGLASGWETVVDAAVYKSSGIRMPWSAKGRGDTRVYVPRGRIDVAGALSPMDPPCGVAAIRACVRDLSIRTFDREPTVVVDAAADDDAESATSGTYAHKSLAAYADVLPSLAAALPVEFLGQRFTNVLAGEACFLLRSTARHCFNLGRAHRNNNVYFVLTRRGVSQRCYCRCETTEERRYGFCRDFASEVWPVPSAVTAAFFGESRPSSQPSPPPQAASTAPPALAAMPSRARMDFDTILRRSRPAAAAAAAKPAAKRRRKNV